MESRGRPIYHLKVASLKVLERSLNFKKSGGSNDGHLHVGGGNMFIWVDVSFKLRL